MRHLLQHLIAKLEGQLKQEEINISRYDKVTEKDLLLISTGKRIALLDCLTNLRSMIEYEKQV